MSQNTTPPPSIPRDELEKYSVYIVGHTGDFHQPLGHGSGVITNLKSIGFDVPQQVQVSPTEGTIIDPNYPLIATCAHVVQSAPALTVETSDGKRVPAIVLQLDRDADIALLYPLGAENIPSFHNFAVVGDSSAVKHGDTVYAIGTPLDAQFKFNFTGGLISAVYREAPVDSRGRSMTYLKSFATDTGIKPGNSGGPLFNKQGHWIGMNYAGLMTASQNDFGINSSLHVNDIMLIFKRMIEENGIIRPGLQVGVRPLMEADAIVCDFLDMSPMGPIPREDGVFIEYVKPGSDSAQYFKCKDIILQVNGDVVRHMTDFRRAVFFAAGKPTPVKFRIWRDAQEITFDLDVPKVVRPFAHMVPMDFLGMHITDSFVDDGITVVTLTQGPAVAAGIMPDTIITGIEDPANLGQFLEVHTVQEFYETCINGHFANQNYKFYIRYKRAGRTALAPMLVNPALADRVVQAVRQANRQP